MKPYITPVCEVLELLQTEVLAAIVQSEPIVEDNDDDLSV